MDPGQTKLLRVNELLTAEYGQRRWQSHHEPVSELILTILSQHTADTNSHRAFEALRVAYPTWEQVLSAPEEQVAEVIRSAGLANIKARRIKETLAMLAQRSNLDLAFLATMDLAEAKAWLRSLQGVGPKTAACVLLFSLGRPALPVDTHVFRVSRRLGLIDQKMTADAAHEALEKQIPEDQVYSFHINMVTHGRQVCKAQSPHCGVCRLQPECDYATERVP